MPQRIAIFDAYPHVEGGVQLLTLALMEGLPARDVQVKLVTPAEGTLTEAAASRGLDVSVVHAPPSLRRYGSENTTPVRSLLALPGYWSRLAPALAGADAAVVNDPRGLLLGGPAARRARRPVLWWMHSTPGRVWMDSVVQMTLRRAVRRTVVPSTAVRAGLPRTMRSHTDVIAPPLLRDVRPASTVARQPATVVTAGRLHPNKGIDVLIRAIAELRAAGRDVRATVLGAQDPWQKKYSAELGQLVQQLCVADLVTFAGHVPAPDDYWHDAAVYVQASRAEPCSMATLEAAVSGLPLIMCDVGGQREFITHRGAVGLLVPPDDPVRLAEAIAQSVDDLGLRHRAQAARSQLRNVFDINEYCRQFLDACSRVISTRPA